MPPTVAARSGADVPLVSSSAPSRRGAGLSSSSDVGSAASEATVSASSSAPKVYSNSVEDDARIAAKAASLTAAHDDDIAKLNAQVKLITEMYEQGEPYDPRRVGKESIKAVQAGRIVYHHRNKVIVYSLFALIPLCLGLGVAYVGPVYVALSVLLCAFLVDFYGAVLHVVLDHPPFIEFPLIGDGCLEFQWHHAIPRDIVSKPFVEVVGDLNVIALVHVGVIAVAYGGLSCWAANTMGAAKLAMAFLGQWAHRQCHEMEKDRPQWVKGLQAVGVLVNPKLHNAHHRTYDDGFPILNGLSAPLVKALVTHMPIDRFPYAWLALFVAMTFFDVILVTTLAKAICGVA